MKPFFPFLLFLTVFLGCATEPEIFVPERVELARPNVVWIVAEDLSPILPMFGDSTVATPNLTRLAERGTTFTNCFSPSPVCAPSRAAIATGMYPISIGAHNMRAQWNREHLAAVGLEPYEVVPPAGVRMMSEHLRRAGYYCTNNAKTDYQFKPTLTAWDESSNYAHYRDRRPGQPFFAVFNLDVTHESRLWMPASKDMLRFEDPDFPDRNRPTYGWQENHPHMRWNLPGNAEVPIPPYLMNDDSTRWTVRRAYSNVVAMDRQVGNLLDQLEADGLLDSTIIFFYGDHGGPLPRQKRLLFDSGIRAPLLVSYPGTWDDGRRDTSLISFVDFAPTVLELAGIDLPDYLQGHSFAYEKDPPRRHIHAAADRFDAIPDRSRAVTDGRWKYIRHYFPERPYYMPVAYRENIAAMRSLLRARDAGALNPTQALWFRETKPREELFDTQTDPHELVDLARDPRYAARLRELAEAMDQFLEEMNDRGAIEEKKLVAAFQTNGAQPTASPDTEHLTFGFRRPDSVYVTENTWEIASFDEVPPDHLWKQENYQWMADRIGYAPWYK